MKSMYEPLNILSLNLDVQILDSASAVAERERNIGNHLQTYTLLIPYLRDCEVPLGESVTAWGIGGRIKPVQLVRMYFKARSLIKQSHYDVVTVADNYYLTLLGWSIARQYNLGFEIQVHGFEKFSGARAFVAKRIMPRADAIRVVSSRLKKLLVTQFGVLEEGITIAPLFLEWKPTPANPTELDSQILHQKGNDFIFLTVARLVPVKNILLQLQAFKNIIAEYPDTKLWIVGDGPERAQLEEEARDLSLADHVRFWGWHAEVSAFYAHADSYLLSSDSEGWPLVILEAAAHRLPILMTDVGCAREFIRDGENGLVVPVGDKEAFLEGMEKIRTDATLREALGKAAKDSLAALLSREELMRRYVSSWERAIHNT